MQWHRRFAGMLLAALALACASAPKNENESFYTSAEWEENAPEPDDPCRGKSGAPLECRSDDECCDGFVCTIDPERSRIRRFCIET